MNDQAHLKRECVAPPTPMQMNEDFVFLLNALRSSGGISRAHELRVGGVGGAATSRRLVQDWIADRRLLSIPWSGHSWLPLFQLPERTIVPNPQMSSIIRTLSPVLDEWEIALWFATPNNWLQGSLPAMVFIHQPECVFQAARADRFAING